MSEIVSEDMSDRVLTDMWERMSEDISEKLSMIGQKEYQKFYRKEMSKDISKRILDFKYFKILKEDKNIFKYIPYIHILDDISKNNIKKYKIYSYKIRYSS